MGKMNQRHRFEFNNNKKMFNCKDIITCPRNETNSYYNRNCLKNHNF